MAETIHAEASESTISTRAQHTPVPMAPGYFASRDGRILSASGWRGRPYRELAQDLNDDGYPSVRILIDGRRKRISVHRLVASAFLLAQTKREGA